MTVSYPHASSNDDPTAPLKISGFGDNITPSLDNPGHVYVDFELSRNLDPFETRVAEDAGLEIDHYNGFTTAHFSSRRLEETLSGLNNQLAEVEKRGKVLRNRAESAVENTLRELREIDFGLSQ